MAVHIDVSIEVWELASAVEGMSERQLKAFCEDLSQEAKKRIAAEITGAPELEITDTWDRIERALQLRDFHALADVLWPEVKARWIRPKMTNAYAQPAPSPSSSESKG